jgi:hypothetical protein
MKFFLLLGALCAESVFAGCGTGCGAGCGSGRWMVEGEFLYLLPSIDDTFFVLKSPALTSPIAPTPFGKRINNDFGFHPGFRVKVGYQSCTCCQGLEVAYARLGASTTRTVRGILWATIGDPLLSGVFQNYVGLARSKLNLVYQRVDGLFSKQAWCGRNMNLFFIAGVEYANFQLRENYFYASNTAIFSPPLTAFFTSGKIDLKSNAWGVGPEFGFKFRYFICLPSCLSKCSGNLSIVAGASGSLLASKTQQNTRNIIIGATVLPVVKVQDERVWRIIPAFHGRAGLNYAVCFSCFGASLEVGYEFDSYLRFFTRSIYTDDVAPQVNFSNYYNFDAQGLYVSLALTY